MALAKLRGSWGRAVHVECRVRSLLVSALSGALGAGGQWPRPVADAIALAVPGAGWHPDRMPERSRKPKRPPNDPNKAARRVLDAVIEATEGGGKNPAAVALGRMGGLKGGKARAAGMTPKQRTASAKRAAKARWG